MLEVVSILGFSSFQDMGRSGFRSLGLTRSGAADYYATVSYTHLTLPTKA